MIQKLAVRLALVPLMVLAVSCSKKQKSDVEATPSVQTETTPSVESTPMNFDAAGSDSGKIDGLSTVFFFSHSAFPCKAFLALPETVALS